MNLKYILFGVAITLLFIIILSATNENNRNIGKYQIESYENTNGYIVLINDTETGIVKEVYKNTNNNQLGIPFEKMNEKIK